MTEKSLDKKEPKKITFSSAEEMICFVISPIGKEGTKEFKEFKEVLQYIIKPAFEESNFKFSVIRADDINRSGSFIKDILENIYSSHIVIADLTGQNPNVFYELGVRHSLRPRTILIAQNLDDIPSDLREYRTIIYDTSAKGASAFKARIKEFLKEIQKEPNRPDNPVLDRLGNITEDRIIQLESEKAALKEELTKYLSGKEPLRKKKPGKVDSNVSKRFNRVLKLKSAEEQHALGGTFTRGEESYSLPHRQGNFNLYFLLEGKSIVGYWYVSLQDFSTDISDQLADIRVLMETCSKGQDVSIDFILVVPETIENREQYIKAFNKMKNKLNPQLRKYFKFFLIDPEELEEWEKEFGLVV